MGGYGVYNYPTELFYLIKPNVYENLFGKINDNLDIYNALIGDECIFLNVKKNEIQGSIKKENETIYYICHIKKKSENPLDK